jgi:hypothetical protein
MMGGMPMMAPMNIAAEYQMKASILLPSIQPNNRVYKQKVGEFIFPYIAKMTSQEKAPRLTGMLIELPLEQVKEFLGNYQVLSEMVQEGNSLLDGSQ